jgi:hypothetical protein
MSKGHAVHICSTSAGLDDLTRRKQRDFAEVLRVLHRTERFSMFEATANNVIAQTMDDIIKLKLIETDISCGFPWTKVKLTSAGLERAGIIETDGADDAE